MSRIAPKPDPISSVDASHLLEDDEVMMAENGGGTYTSGGESRLDSSSVASVGASPMHPTGTGSLLARPASPHKPPTSIVGGFGLPKLSTLWSKKSPTIMIIQTVDFTVVQKGLECHLRLLVMNRPARVEPLLTQEQWDDLRNRFDELGVRIKWDVYRSLILLVIIFVMVVIVNSGDEIGESFSLGDFQMSILIVLGVILLKLVFDECYENYSRRSVFHEVDTACKEFSAVMRPRGACLAFRFADNDDLGLLADLVFYQVEAAPMTEQEKIMLNIA